MGRMDALLEDVADHPGGVRPGLLRPAHQALRRPLGMFAMVARHVFALGAAALAAQLEAMKAELSSQPSKTTAERRPQDES